MATTADYAQLPSLQTDYSLTADQKAAYQRNGHILLKQVASRTRSEAYEPIIAGVVREHDYNTKPVSERDTYGKAFIQIGNLWQMNEGAKRFVMARRFAKIAAELMGVQGVRIYHDQALVQRTGRRPYAVASGSDLLAARYAEYDHALDAARPRLRRGRIDDVRRRLADARLHEPSSDLRRIAQDAQLVHRGQTAAEDELRRHGGRGRNVPCRLDASFRAGQPDRCDAGSHDDHLHCRRRRIIEPDSKARENDMKGWFPGLGPGDVAASALNPLVYKA